MVMVCCDRSRGVCKGCSCVQEGKPCVDCLPGRVGNCQNTFGRLDVLVQDFDIVSSASRSGERRGHPGPLVDSCPDSVLSSDSDGEFVVSLSSGPSDHVSPSSISLIPRLWLVLSSRGAFVDKISCAYTEVVR